MCLIFFAVNSHPTYKLIIAGNRDEFYNRKTAPVNYWTDYPSILGGRDLEAGGTWMAMNKAGKIGFITNYRDPQHINPMAPSRGPLVSDYLHQPLSPEAYLHNIEKSDTQYNGFNLVVGNTDELWYHSNYKTGIEKITPGLHGLSNHLLETPWPKVERGKEMLKPLLDRTNIDPHEVLMLLFNTEQAPDDALPNTGVPLERERALSSMFIQSPGYGSRCSTVVLVTHAGHVIFSERTYDLTTFQYTTKSFQFNMQA